MKVVDLGIWRRLTQFVIGLLGIAALIAVGLWYLPLIQQNERMRKQILELENQIQAEETQGKRLEGAITALKTDPKAVERMAREKLGYARPGETVIFFQEKNKLIIPQVAPRR